MFRKIQDFESVWMQEIGFNQESVQAHSGSLSSSERRAGW